MNTDSPFMLLFIGLLYIVAMGGLSLVRREGLSIQFAIESLIIVAVVSGLGFASGTILHPVLFLILLYLLTMRVRLVVDLGNSLASSRRFAFAEQIYNLAQTLGPDPASRVNLTINRGVARLQQGQLDEAISLFKDVLKNHAGPSLGIKNEAACLYNLGVAYERKGQAEEAGQAYKNVLDVWPVSEYGRRASVALARQAHEGEVNVIK